MDEHPDREELRSLVDAVTAVGGRLVDERRSGPFVWLRFEVTPDLAIEVRSEYGEVDATVVRHGRATSWRSWLEAFDATEGDVDRPVVIERVADELGALVAAREALWPAVAAAEVDHRRERRRRLRRSPRAGDTTT